jgi:hypothetical protein
VDIELGIMDFALKQIVEKEELMAQGCEMMAANLVSKVKDGTIGDTVAREKKPWEASLELGAGTLIAATFSYMRIGLTAGFDVGKEEVENAQYNSSLIHLALFYNLNLRFLLPKKTPQWLSLNLRPKVGLNFVTVDKFFTTAYEVSPQVLLGYRDFYALLSPSYLICDVENILLFQLGIGYRIIF